MAGHAPASTPRRHGADTPLNTLRRRLAEGASQALRTLDTTGGLAALCVVALKHVEALREQGFDTLPWRVGLFGRAHTTRRKLAYLHPNRCGSVKILDLDTGRREVLPPPDMHYGAAIATDADVTTEGSDALLLFDDGTLVHLPPYHTGAVQALGRPWVQPRPLDAGS